MNFTRFRLAMWATIALAFFGVLQVCIPDRALIAILNGVFLGVIVAIAIVYTPLVWYTLRGARMDRVSQLSTGIALLWLSTAIQRAWSFYFRYQGAPPSLMDSWVVSFVAYLAIIGGALFVTAPGYPSSTANTSIELWGANRKLLLTLGAIGGLTTFALSVYPGIRI